MAAYNDESKIATVSKRQTSNTRKALGTVYDQRFYALRAVPCGKTRTLKLSMPFAAAPFNALIYATLPISSAILRDISLNLFRHGMRQAVCCGSEADTMGEILDDIADEFSFHHDGRPVFTSIHDDESLAEVLDYFILPNGLADKSLILVIGNDKSFREALRTFAKVAGSMREKL